LLHISINSGSVNVDSFYGNHGRGENTPSAFYITEDNLTGEDDDDNGIPDDEAIYVHGATVDADMKQLRIFVTMHDANGRTLADVTRVGLRIAPLVDGEPDLTKQVTFDVRDFGTNEGAYMGMLTRAADGGWELKTTGEAAGDLGSIASSHGIATS